MVSLLFLLLLLPILLSLLRHAGVSPRQARAVRDAARWCTHGAGLVINDGGRGSSSSAPPHLVKPKRAPGLATVKQEPGLAAVKPEPALAEEADKEEAALKWAREDYARMELDCQRRALEEIVERRRREAARRGEGSSSGVGRVKEEKQEDDAGDDYALLSAYFGP